MKNCFLSIWLSLSSALLMDQVRQVEVVKRSEVMTLAGFNPDNGFMLGGMFTSNRYGFKKDPYKSSHLISGLYSFETDGFRINYSGHWIDVLGEWNLGLEALLQDKFFTNNL